MKLPSAFQIGDPVLFQPTAYRDGTPGTFEPMPLVVSAVTFTKGKVLYDLCSENGQYGVDDCDSCDVRAVEKPERA